MTDISLYKPRPLQKDFHDNKKRWNAMICHRRFGKSVMAINDLIRSVMLCRLERPRFAYIAPTYKDAKRIAWDYLKHYASRIPGTTFNEAELRADFLNGGRIMLLGSDNPDSLRGIYLDGVVLDEYAMIKPNLFNEIIRPALADRKGWALFISTPKGKNHFYEIVQQAQKDPEWYFADHKASQTGYIDPEEVKAAQIEYERAGDMDTFNQEFENSFDAALKGAIFGENMKQAREEGRITKFPHWEGVPVHTAWDIGNKDATVITFFQILNKEVRIIDCYANNNSTIPHYVEVLKSKPYLYGTHYLPHDAKHQRLSMNNYSVENMLNSLGIDKTQVLEQDLYKQLSIDRAKKVFRYIWFNEGTEGGEMLIRALHEYHRKYDDRTKRFRDTPEHDWASDYADSFQYACTAISMLIEQNSNPDSSVSMTDFLNFLDNR